MAGEAERGDRVVDARGECQTTEVAGDEDGRGARRGVVVRDVQIELRLGGDRVAAVHCPVQGARGEPGHRGAWTHAHVTDDVAGIGVGDRRRGKHREVLDRSDIDWRWPLYVRGLRPGLTADDQRAGGDHESDADDRPGQSAAARNRHAHRRDLPCQPPRPASLVTVWRSPRVPRSAAPCTQVSTARRCSPRGLRAVGYGRPRVSRRSSNWEGCVEPGGCAGARPQMLPTMATGPLLHPLLQLRRFTTFERPGCRRGGMGGSAPQQT